MDMAPSRWDQRFFGTTRGQVVQLLRRASRTVEELAGALGLTDNAVRAHLATLERDGLVSQQGLRRGVGKPAYAYGLTSEAERLFPKAYGPVLQALLGVLAERLPPAEVELVLREVGRRLASGTPSTDDPPRRRAEQAVALLNDLGGLAELEQRNGTATIRGYNCPLAAVVREHPEICGLVETLLAELIGAPVQESCERGDPPRCCFVLAANSSPA
jgi:predicted ArsR family transcriptional regulator